MAEQRLSRRRSSFVVGSSPGASTVLRVVSTTPRIYVADGFLTNAEADRIAAFGATAELAAVGVETRHNSTGFSFELDEAFDPLVADVRARIEHTLGVRNSRTSSLRYRRYTAGEAHPPHHDHYEIDGAHLIATAMVCLTDVAEGGATRFPAAHPPIEVSPARGRLVVWLDHAPDGSPDLATLHDGAPVVRGVKTTVTDFIYGDPACALVRFGPRAAA